MHRACTTEPGHDQRGNQSSERAAHTLPPDSLPDLVQGPLMRLSLLSQPLSEAWRKRGFAYASRSLGMYNEVTSLQKKRPLCVRVMGLDSGMGVMQP